MIRAALLCLLAGSASADSVDISGSVVTLQDSTRAGALAEIVFDNRDMNTEKDDGDYLLRLGALNVMVQFTFSSGLDRLTVTPPEGVSCYPSCVTETESRSSVIWLFDATGVGM